MCWQRVKIFNNFALDIKTFLAYAENFKGGVNVAVGDVNGDGQKEIITAPGNGGGPHIRIFDQEGNIISQFFAYSTKFSGGVNLAVGDVDADGVEDIITAPMGQYQPEIKIFDLLGEEKNNFLAYDVKFNGGVSVTTSDVNLDGTSEIVTAPSKGGGPHIRIFNQSGKVMGQFFADDKKYRGDQDERGVPEPGQPFGFCPFVNRQNGNEENKCFLGEDPQGKKNQCQEVGRTAFFLQMQMKEDQHQ